MNYFIAGVMRPCFVPPALICAGANQHLAPLRLGGRGGYLPTVLSLLAEVCDSVILIVPCVPSLGGWESGQDGGERSKEATGDPQILGRRLPIQA